MTRTILRRAVLAGVTGVAAVALAACGSGDHSSMPDMHHGTSGAAQTSGASAAATSNDADATFARQMIPHHQQAVDMTALADTRTSDPDVKKLAGQIKAAQAPEIATMTGWLANWGTPMPTHSMGGGTNMPGMDHGGMPGMMSEADMTKLTAASGRDFDRQFLTMMIAHHQGAISMAKDELAQGTNVDAKALAQQIVTSQQAEIDTMNKILARI